MLPDSNRVIQIIRETAEIEILPRFRTLADNDIREKAPGDLVTIADIESEKRLSRYLLELLPGSVVLGEEGCADHPELIKLLQGEAPVWVIDPVDGTHNFANGKDCFAVIISLVHKQNTLCGWIHDPVKNMTIHAIAGQGAWESNKRLRYPSTPAVDTMKGGLPNVLQKKLRGLYEDGVSSVPTKFDRYRCAGQEYMDLARGKFHFVRFAKSLKPWDHAAGVLIHQEAGGYAATHHKTNLEKYPYSPAKNYENTALLLTPDEQTWSIIEEHVKS